MCGNVVANFSWSLSLTNGVDKEVPHFVLERLIGELDQATRLLTEEAVVVVLVDVDLDARLLLVELGRSVNHLAEQFFRALGQPFHFLAGHRPFLHQSGGGSLCGLLSNSNSPVIVGQVQTVNTCNVSCKVGIESAEVCFPQTAHLQCQRS